MTTFNDNYTLRLIASPKEMKEALALRYNTYKEAFPNSVNTDWSLQYEADHYDLNSLHFGLFYEENGLCELAGYFRMVFDTRHSIPGHINSHTDSTLQVIRETVFLNKVRVSDEPLYYLNDVKDSVKRQGLTTWIDSLSSAAFPMTEVSRLIISKDHRSGSAAKHFVAAIFALYPYLNLPYAIFMCEPRQVKTYNRYGLNNIPGMNEFISEEFGARQMMYGQYESYSPVFKRMIESFVQDYENSGMVVDADTIDQAA